MKKLALEAAFFGGVVLFVAGCPNPDLARTPMGQEEQAWNQVFRADYGAYRFPRTAPPAVADNVSAELLKKEEQARLNGQNPADAVVMEEAAVQEHGSAGSPPSPISEVAPGDAASSAAQLTDTAAAVNAPVKAAAVKEETKAPAEVKEAAKTEKKAEAKTATPAADANQEIYVVKSGDTLGKIALKYYGSASKADLLIRANKSKVKNPKQLRVGTKLIIPKF